MAGMTAAVKAQMQREPIATESTSGPHLPTPYSCEDISLLAASAKGMPNRRPIPTCLKAPRKTSWTMLARSAPKAMRTPISLVRRAIA